MPDPFAAPNGTLDVRYRAADQIRVGGALANLASGPEITSHETPARLIAWPGTGFQTEAVHVLTLAPGHEGERYRYDLAEEAFLCHSGSAEVWMRERWARLEPGDLAYISEDAERALRNTGEETGVLVAQITPPQIDLYLEHGFYNTELAVIDHTAAPRRAPPPRSPSCPRPGSPTAKRNPSCALGTSSARTCAAAVPCSTPAWARPSPASACR